MKHLLRRRLERPLRGGSGPEGMYGAMCIYQCVHTLPVLRVFGSGGCRVAMPLLCC